MQPESKAEECLREKSSQVDTQSQSSKDALQMSPQDTAPHTLSGDAQSQKSSSQAMDATSKRRCRHCSANFEKDDALIGHCLTEHTHLYSIFTTVNTQSQASQAKENPAQTLNAEPKINVFLTKTSDHVCRYCKVWIVSPLPKVSPPRK